jgi:hypothetical protein
MVGKRERHQVELVGRRRDVFGAPPSEYLLVGDARRHEQGIKSPGTLLCTPY